jgi:exodeoxyribonuclease VII small subunit
MAKETKIESLTYEQAFQELEAIVSDLEAEISDLDAAIKLFERGQALAKHCSAVLEKAELKVQELTEDGDMKDSSAE